VAQEASANAAKHGDAHRIVVILDYTNTNTVRLAVEDDGIGFEPAAPVPDGHFGLLGIRERTQKLGGRIQLHSQPGRGTTVEVIVPLAG
jgi:signal transduction histidine kinase